MLHPIRMRIIQTFLSFGKMTVQQLIEKLNDIPQATMYRHLKLLHDGGLVDVVETHKVRGTIEKVYAVKTENLEVSDKEINETEPEEHLRFFMTYQANLLKEFEQYIMNNDPEKYKEDGLGFRQATVHLTNDELEQFIKELRDVMQKYVNYAPSKERTPRTFASIFIPQKKRG